MTEINTSVAIDQSNADEAYDNVLPEAMGLNPDLLVTMNLDVPTCTITAMGVLEKLPAYRDRILALPHTPTERFGNFQTYVLALFSAQGRYTFATTPPEPLPELLAEATEKRDVLITEAKALAARKLMNGDLLKELTGTHGYKNVAFDLSGLSRMFKTSWPTIQGKTGLQMSEMEEADKLALRLAAAIAHRSASPEVAAAATDVRQRMFTIFADVYDQLRRAIAYLRWDEGDVDEIIPSLYAGRPNSNLKSKTLDSSQSAVSAAEPAAAAGSASSAAVAPTTNKVPVGFPGSDPLTGA